MRALIEKEIRLLLPAFAGALVLAIVPVWLLPVEPRNPGAIAGWFYLFGAVMLALSTFGREVGLKTVPFILAQPLARSRIWWTKIVVLVVCSALTYDAWWLSACVSSVVRPGGLMPPEALALSALVVAVLTAGGLWMTLLLRQIVAAFWLALLIPWVIIVSLEALGGTDWIICAALGVDAVAAFFLARWQFLHLQDTAWTGGVVSLGSSRVVAASADLRERRPWGAMLRKELKLHEFTLAGIFALFVLHLGVVVLRNTGGNFLSKPTLSVLEVFGLVWLIVPLLAGSQSVAEERQLGTLDGLLALPVSRRAQYWIKLIFVLLLGGLLSAALLCAAERIGGAFGAAARLDWVGINFQFVPVSVVFVLLSLAGFYASTLTRSLVQSLGAGVVVTFSFWWIYGAGSGMYDDGGLGPFSLYAFGSILWPIVAIPTLIAAILWLGYGNFKWVFETGRRWRRNIITLVSVNALICGAVAGVHHRIWEWAMPLEGAHGPAGLPAGKPVMFRSYGGPGLAIVLPDGRLWTDRLAHDDGWVSLGGNHFVPGSKWVDAFADSRDTAAIRSDGTLWVSAKPRQPWLDRRPPPPEESAPLVQFGVESNWQSIQRFRNLLLKRDGTLWSWGTSDIDNKHYEGLGSFTPQRFNADSDWARILQGVHWTYAWKRDGTAWALFRGFPPPLNLNNIRLPALDHIGFRSLNSVKYVSDIDVAVRDDGTLWYWQNFKEFWYPPTASVPFPKRVRIEDNGTTGAHVEQNGAEPSAPFPKLVQIGKESNWVAVTAGPGQVFAMKTDGSIWKWSVIRGGQLASSEALQEEPHRVGTHSDWVAVGCWMGQTVALSADGSLWQLPKADYPMGWSDEDFRGWLAPSRRPVEIENILAHEEAGSF
jgi:ABC-type transport system involved in multi-copper enzyme maturation permease subunit